MPVQVGPVRINDVLNNLEIKFVNCNFIFSTLPIVSATTTQNLTKKRKSRIPGAKLLTKMSKILNEERNIYINCILGSHEEEIKKQINLYSNEHICYTFLNCRFIKRESHFLENIGFKLRRLLGITFSTDYLHGKVEIVNYKLKIKYIPEWTDLIIGQMSEED